MDLIPVAGSQRIAAYGWEPRWSRTKPVPRHERLGLLLIEFTDGAKWYFFNVPEELFELFLLAKSRGSFFHRHIRGRFAELPAAEVDQPQAIAPGDPIAPDY